MDVINKFLDYKRKLSMNINRQKQIFIVDDDKQLLSLLRDICEIEGWLVEVASNITQAKKLLETYQADCFVIDLKLPDGDGNDLIKHLRTCHSAPILAISGAGQDGHSFTLAATSQLGADYHLGKPFEPDELIIECRRLMNLAVSTV
ncbi:MAG: DNA-binding response OmpR family regulator [Enterobacterales bacterium]|jgi:DNA-binding response OmpR family regulator